MDTSGPSTPGANTEKYLLEKEITMADHWDAPGMSRRIWMPA